jgi:hypothetical protein
MYAGRVASASCLRQEAQTAAQAVKKTQAWRIANGFVQEAMFI